MSTDRGRAFSALMPLSASGAHGQCGPQRDIPKKRNALIAVDRAERSSGDSNPIEIRRRLDAQRGELGWHRQNVG